MTPEVPFGTPPSPSAVLSFIDVVILLPRLHICVPLIRFDTEDAAAIQFGGRAISGRRVGEGRRGRLCDGSHHFQRSCNNSRLRPMDLLD